MTSQLHTTGHRKGFPKRRAARCDFHAHAWSPLPSLIPTFSFVITIPAQISLPPLEKKKPKKPQKYETAEPLSEEDLATLAMSPDAAVVMTAHDGQRYFCSMPPAVSEGVDGSSTDGSSSASAADESSKSSKPAARAFAATKTAERDGKVISELLEPLTSACFYRIEGWWTYEFCHKNKVRQYHQEGQAITSEYSLGEYDARATATLHDTQGHFPEAPGSTGSNERFHAHIFSGGTPCDLTDLERQTEVRFVCAPTGGINAITAIKEPATCKYTFTFATPLLCHHRSFKVQEKPVSHIKCKAFSEDGGGGGGGGGGEEGGSGGGQRGESTQGVRHGKASGGEGGGDPGNGETASGNGGSDGEL